MKRKDARRYRLRSPPMQSEANPTIFRQNRVKILEKISDNVTAPLLLGFIARIVQGFFIFYADPRPKLIPDRSPTLGLGHNYDDRVDNVARASSLVNACRHYCISPRQSVCRNDDMFSKCYYMFRELAWRSGSVMDCHATARGSIPGGNGVFTELHVLRKGQ